MAEMETQGTLQKNFGLAVWRKTKEKARERVRAQRAANLCQPSSRKQNIFCFSGMMGSMESNELLTVVEAAHELCVTPPAVHSALYEGRLPCVVKYGRKLIARPDLDAYKQRTQPNGVKKVGRPRKGQTEAEA